MNATRLARWTPLAVAFLLALALCPASAWAAHGHRVVEFEKLGGRIHRGQLELRYAIDRHDWRRLKRKHVAPTLNLWVAAPGSNKAHFAYSQHVRSRKGSFTYPKSVTLRHGNIVEVELVGYEKDYRIEKVTFRKQTRAWINFTVRHHKLIPGVHRRQDQGDQNQGDQNQGDQEQADQTPPVDPHWRVDVINACKRAVYSSKVDECVADATKLAPRRAAGTVAACASAFGSASYIHKCLVAARHQTFEPAKTIEACKHTFGSYSYIIQCMDTAKSYKTEPSPAITACAHSFGSYPHMIQCMSSAATFTTPPAPVVDACGHATASYSHRHACLDTARGLGSSAVDLIKACRGARVTQCLESARR